MSIILGTFLYDAVIFSIQMFTALLFGLSLVGVKLRENSKKLILIGVASGITYATLTINFGEIFPIVFIGFMVIPIVKFFIKIPYTQAIVAILLSNLFHLLFVNLLEYNLLNLLLELSGIQVDFGIKLSIDLLIALNNILFSIIIFSKTPLLFPTTLFERQFSEDESEISFSGHIFFVVLMLVLLLIGVFYTTLELEHIRLHYRLFITFWSIIICLTSVFFLRRIILHKNESIQVFLDKQYQKELLSFFQIIRSQRHDFNFHLTALYGLIQKGEYEACKTYIEEMTKSATNVNDLLPLHHPGVSAMLSTFKGIAQKDDIVIHFLLMDDMRDMPCSVYEMNKILGNLIQNALDEVGCFENERRIVYVEITKELSHIIIRVTNYTRLNDNEIVDLFAIGYSTKSMHEGLGLPMVKKITEKYNGIIYPELADDKISFHVQIPVD